MDVHVYTIEKAALQLEPGYFHVKASLGWLVDSEVVDIDSPLPVLGITLFGSVTILVVYWQEMRQTKTGSVVAVGAGWGSGH